MDLHQKNSEPSYETLSEAMNGLKKRGFVYEFDYKDAHIYHHHGEEHYEPSQLKIVEIYRFEGMSNPSDNSILYAIECIDGNKGLIVDAYGAYADPEKTSFMSEIEIKSE